jgi:hypothetical protein
MRRRATRQRPAAIIPARVARTILMMRGHNVMLDADLADLYQVNVKVLNQAVKRNRARFPSDFMFKLTAREAGSIRSQLVTLESQRESKRGRHRKYLPYVFTEQGVAMLSSVLRSPRAVQVNIEIMRAFVHLRQMLQSNTQLLEKLNALARKSDARFATVFEAIRELMTPPTSPTRQIGFRVVRSGGESSRSSRRVPT